MCMLQGNCTGPAPTMKELGLDASLTLLDLQPRQCVLVMANNANYMLTGDTWIDGVYWKQAPNVGGTLQLEGRLWLTHSTYDLDVPSPDCDDCTESKGGIEVKGGLYVQGAAAFACCISCVADFLPVRGVVTSSAWSCDAPKFRISQAHIRSI